MLKPGYSEQNLHHKHESQYTDTVEEGMTQNGSQQEFGYTQ